MGACLRPQAAQPTGKPDVVQLRTSMLCKTLASPLSQTVSDLVTEVLSSQESSYSKKQLALQQRKIMFEMNICIVI